MGGGYDQQQPGAHRPPQPQSQLYGGAGMGGGGEDPWYSASQHSPSSSPAGAGQGGFGGYGGGMPQSGMGYSSGPGYGMGGYAGGGYGGMMGGAGDGMSAGVDDFENEPPLLEELGVRVDHIWSKTQAVIHPFKGLSEHILDDADLAGPLLFCLLLGSCLLLAGKVHFGYIYGFGIFGCLFMYAVVNLLSSRSLDVWLTCSALGYCLLPVVCLAAVNIVVSLRGLLGLVLAVGTIAWSTHTATRLLDARLNLKGEGQFWLVAYPAALLYGCFVLITIF